MVKWLAQMTDVGTSLAETVTDPQLPEMVPPWLMKPSASVAAAGTAEAHCTFAVGGQVMVSGATKRRTRSLLLFANSSLKLPLPRELPKLAVLRLNVAGSKFEIPSVVLTIRQA